MAVTPDTIAVALGRTAPATDDPEYQQWDMWINDALMLIEARLGDPTLLDQAKLDYVVREAVVAHVRRPDDATQISVSVDDGSTSRTYRSGKGRVVILDEWWDLLGSDDKSGAFSIRPYGSGMGAAGHAPWCDLMFGGDTCSCGYTLTAGASWMWEPS
jgi:hypothetical protein